MRKRPVLKILAVVATLIAAAAAVYFLAASRTASPYTNEQLGLSFTPAPGLVFEETSLTQIPASAQTVVLFQAYGTKRMLSGRKGTVADIDRLSYYPEGQRSPEAYLGKVVRNQRADGYEVLSEKSDCKLGGLDCVRADFRKGTLFEAVEVTTRGEFALVFIFTAGSKDELNQVIDSSHVAFKEK